MRTVYNSISYIISVIFHPIWLFPVYIFIISGLDPFALGVENKMLQFNLFFFSVLYPGIAMLILYLSRFISNINLRQRKERIAPYMITIIFYLWMYLNLRNQLQINEAIVKFSLGLCIALSIGFFTNLFSKVSLHMMAAGAMFIGIFILWQYFQYNYLLFRFDKFSYQVHLSLLLSASILISGLVASARLQLKAHIPQEIYGGLLIGVFSQLLAINV